jgi:hypothetical protein
MEFRLLGPLEVWEQAPWRCSGGLPTGRQTAVINPARGGVPDAEGRKKQSLRPPRRC